MLLFLSRSPFSNLLIAMCFDFSVLATEEAQSDDGEENSILDDSGTDDTTAENDSATNSSAASLLQQQNDRLRVTNGLNGSASARSHNPANSPRSLSFLPLRQGRYRYRVPGPRVRSRASRSG